MRIVVIAGYSKSLLNFRKELLQSIVKAGNDVYAIGPEPGYEDELNKLGVKFKLIPFNRLSLNPIKDIFMIKDLMVYMRKERIDLFFGYTIKPVIFGSLAAFLAGVPNRYAMVTGLGSLFIEGAGKSRLIKNIALFLYKFGFYFNKKVIFQNYDDIEYMVSNRIIEREKCVKVNGSGVNTEYFAQSPMPSENIFLFMGSLMRDKGIMEYIVAASIVRKKHPDSRFWILGSFDSRLSGVRKEEILKYSENGDVEYLGVAKDVRPFLDKCRYYVLPSYREGTPRSVLEAMAKGRPIITTDAPGCKETVENNINGYIVPTRNSEILAEKMIDLIENREKTEKMAHMSRQLAEKKFDVNTVNDAILKEMGIVT